MGAYLKINRWQELMLKLKIDIKFLKRFLYVDVDRMEIFKWCFYFTNTINGGLV